MKNILLFTVTLFCLNVEAKRCDKSHIPPHALSKSGDVIIDVVFNKASITKEEAVAYLSKLGNITWQSRRMVSFRVEVACPEIADELAQDKRVIAINLAPPPAETFPGVGIRN